MITIIVLLMLFGLIYFILSLTDKIDKQKSEIKQMQMKKRWDDFSYTLLESELLVRDAIDQCREITSTCEKAIDYMDSKAL
ncbi:hypothetical protein V7157_03885 [Neobacillus drentensis]|uniref:hypothetical protein n=1 Tax=Neobacillus drentensis TaxID=220684 RepID=UPI002FFD71BB